MEVKKINIWLNGIVLGGVYLKKGFEPNNVLIMRDNNYIASFDNKRHKLIYDGVTNEYNDYKLVLRGVKYE